MEALLLKIFTESGLIYLLFFMIVGGFIWKGVPYILKKYDEMTFTFIESLKEVHNNHRKDIELISEVFIQRIQESNSNHKITHDKVDNGNNYHIITHNSLEEIKNILNSKLK